ncbi:hypothetical protein CBM2629_A130029 [Cupriavidus taiwanensis]|nr:hypothetical protein CBM2629_A130029 [Cupriavidus taiwanensis]
MLFLLTFRWHRQHFGLSANRVERVCGRGRSSDAARCRKYVKSINSQLIKFDISYQIQLKLFYCGAARRQVAASFWVWFDRGG